MAVGLGAAVARQVLEHRQHPTRHEPLRNRAGNGRDFGRFGAIGPIANNGIAARHRDVGDRQAIDVNSGTHQVGGDQMPSHARGGQPRSRFAVVECPIAGTGRIGRPMRRSQALHPAAFLIDQHGRFPTDDVPK